MDKSENSLINNNIKKTIMIYTIIMGAIIYFKPSMIYQNNGNLKKFGIKNKKGTVFPLWIIAIITAIISYYFVIFVTKVIK